MDGIKIKKQKNIKGSHLIKEDGKNSLQLEGINFKSLWKNKKYFEINQTSTNDVTIMGEVYGIEAG